MKILFHTSIVSALLFFTIQPAEAQKLTRVGTTAAPFLKIGAGARAAAMGNAVTALSADISGSYWNPSGLAYLTTTQVMISHTDYLADMYHEYDAVAIPMGDAGVLSFALSYLGMPDIERTTIDLPNGTGEMVAANSFSIGIGYASQLTDRFAIGGSLKFIRESIWHSSASSLAGDVGLTYSTLNENLKLGMSISNFGPDMSMDGRDLRIQHDINSNHDGNDPNLNAYLDTEEFPLPVLFRVGLATDIIQLAGIGEDFNWLVSIDAVHPNDDAEHLNIGSELGFRKQVFFRTGYDHLFADDREGGFAVGVGLRYRLFEYDFILDYANVDFGRLNRLNQFTLILTL